MPTTRKQSTPQEFSTRATKRHATGAPAASDAPASTDKTSSRSKRRPSVDPQSSSAKKQKVEPQQDEAPAGINNKENTPSGSQPRRSARSRTPRIVQEVTPGPSLAKSAKGCSHSTSKQATQTTQKPPASTAKAAARSNRGRAKETASAAADAQDTGTDSHDKPNNADLVSSELAAQELKPQSSPSQQDLAVLIPPSGMAASGKASALPFEPFSSPQEQAPALSQQIPAQSSPCTHPSQHGLPPIPHQQPQSLQKPDSPAASALVTSGPAPAAAPAAAAGTCTHPDAPNDPSSQGDSRHSSGHSNDHPIALVARKHLDWDSAGPGSGPQSASSKPPLSRGIPGTGQGEQENAVGSAAKASGDEGWWDPTDVNKASHTNP